MINLRYGCEMGTTTKQTEKRLRTFDIKIYGEDEI